MNCTQHTCGSLIVNETLTKNVLFLRTRRLGRFALVVAIRITICCGGPDSAFIVQNGNNLWVFSNFGTFAFGGILFG